MKKVKCTSNSFRACRKLKLFVSNLSIPKKNILACNIYLVIKVTSEVVLLRKQLSESLESTVQLRVEKDRLEDKIGRHSQSVVGLQSSLDESLGLNAALQEKVRHLEEQLLRNSSPDDAELLKQELVSVQRRMDESAAENETERQRIQLAYDALKSEYLKLQQSDVS